MSFDPENVTPPGARIKVIGVGGGGGNAVNTMIRSGLEGVDFIAANTDVQALRFSLAPHKLQVGKELTRGLGAGADPDIGRDAALEDRHEIQEVLAGSDMVFITAGMGGGTGTGGASVVAQIARELGALTVAVVTKPFTFEGKRRRRHGDTGITRLRECVDTLITIPNQRLLQVASPDLSMIDAFKMADEVLVNAVRGISDIINIPGMVNVDFADVKTVMSCMGQALMGIGAAAGANRAAEAARQAISSPLLEDVDIEGATGILINITAGSDVTLMEVNEACSIIQEAAHEDANIIFGTVIDENLGGSIRVTVIATGFPVEKEESDAAGGLVKPPQPIISPYASRLTTANLTASAKPAARPAPTSSYSPLTKRPEVRAEPSRPVVPPRSESTPQREPAVFAPTAISPLTSPPVDARPEPVPQPETPAAPPSHMIQPSQDEAQELARWTLDFDAALPNSFAGSFIHESQNDRMRETSTAESRLEGAVAAFGQHAEALSESLPSLANSLFEAGFESVSAAPNPGETAETLPNDQDARAGAVKEQAALESFFAPTPSLIGNDLDKKIDEALALAERMRNPRSSSETDDFDVPAFLRNGMKDLPID